MRCLFALVAFFLSATTALADIRADVGELFARDMDSLDFAWVKIEVDRMIDPSIDVEAQLAQIDQMAATIRTMLPPNATTIKSETGDWYCTVQMPKYVELEEPAAE